MILSDPGKQEDEKTKRRMIETVYRPMSLLYGEVAERAISDGVALRLRHGIACSLAQSVSPEGPVRSVAGLGRKAFFKAVSSIPEQWAELSLSRPLIMGIVNVTPDSFSDGGKYLRHSDAIAHGRALLEAGADILDIGGESTRPGADMVSPEEEQNRVLPVIEGLKSLARERGARISIDTCHAQTMHRAVEAGADIVNDVTALSGDPGSLAIIAKLGVPVVLMHMRGTPRTMQARTDYAHAPLEVFRYLEARIAACEGCGIPKARIAIDPGIGFGKTPQQNAQILAYTAMFHGLGVPILIGASRKSFIARLSKGEAEDQRLPGSIAAVLEAVRQGAGIVRVHDVEETRQALEIEQKMSL